MIDQATADALIAAITARTVYDPNDRLPVLPTLQDREIDAYRQGIRAALAVIRAEVA